MDPNIYGFGSSICDNGPKTRTQLLEARLECSVEELNSMYGLRTETARDDEHEKHSSQSIIIEPHSCGLKDSGTPYNRSVLGGSLHQRPNSHHVL